MSSRGGPIRGVMTKPRWNGIKGDGAGSLPPVTTLSDAIAIANERYWANYDRECEHRRRHAEEAEEVPPPPLSHLSLAMARKLNGDADLDLTKEQLVEWMKCRPSLLAEFCHGRDGRDVVLFKNDVMEVIVEQALTANYKMAQSLIVKINKYAFDDEETRMVYANWVLRWAPGFGGHLIYSPVDAVRARAYEFYSDPANVLAGVKQHFRFAWNYAYLLGQHLVSPEGVVNEELLQCVLNPASQGIKGELAGHGKSYVIGCARSWNMVAFLEEQDLEEKSAFDDNKNRTPSVVREWDNRRWHERERHPGPPDEWRTPARVATHERLQRLPAYQ